MPVCLFSVRHCHHLFLSLSLSPFHDEIDQFCHNIQEEIVNNKTYDGLIFVISGHGEHEVDDIILDSESEEYSLEFIFSKFDNKNCPLLATQVIHN